MKLVGDYSDFSELEVKQTRSAKTCYRKRIDVSSDADSSLNRDLLVSGHHSTAGHHLVNLKMMTSRLHSLLVLHNHPFYVSDERSQRYTEIGESNFYSFNNNALRDHNRISFEFYAELLEELKSLVEEDCSSRFGGRAEKYVQKIAQELARMVLPMSTRICLWHSVNLETLFNYITYKNSDFPCHEKFVSEIMDKVLVHSRTTLDYANKLERFESDFPILKGGYVENYVDTSGFDTGVSSYSFSSGKMISPFSSLGKVLKNSKIRGSYIMSGACVAQLQRHRLLNIVLKSVDAGYYIDKYVSASDVYLKWLDYIEGVNYEQELGNYFVPIGKNFLVNYEVSAFDLINILSKRLCYNAQREISEFSFHLVSSLLNAYPEYAEIITKLYAPPCVHNKNLQIKPLCKEGVRYCGQPVWTYNVEDLMDKRIL